MKRNIFAVCDVETEYVVNLTEYLNRKKNLPFEIQAFTSVESLKKYAAETFIELLLISGRAMCREVKELNIGKVIILSEEGRLPEMESYPCVYKYQSTAQVLREVMGCYSQERGAAPLSFPIRTKAVELIGVYSPIRRCLKTSFALVLGQILARDKGVLYINMEEYSGFDELTGESSGKNMSDLLYYVRQRDGAVTLRLNSIIRTVNNLDYIPPVKTPWDIREVPWADWEWFLSELCKSSGYELIILDVGTEVDEIFRLLDLCGRIYMPVLSDRVSRAKLAQFEDLVRLWDYPGILEKTVKVTPPLHLDTTEGKGYIQRLPWTELGDYVRKLLRNRNP